MTSSRLFGLFRRRRAPKAQRAIVFSVKDTHYVLLRRLDSGAEGEQLLLAQPEGPEGAGAPVLVTMLGLSAPHKARERLAEAAWLSSRLSHPAITRAQGLYHRGGCTYLVWEYVPGYSVESLISFGTLRGKPLSEQLALTLGVEVAGALHHLHHLEAESGRPLGLLHRGISPESLRLGLRGEVRLASLKGASWQRPDRQRTSTGLLRGDIEYAAPERLRDAGQDWVDGRSDLFSLGMVMLEVATGQHLYDLEGLEAGEGEGSRPRMELASEVSSWAPVLELARRAASLRPEDVERATQRLSAPFQRVLQRLLGQEPAERHGSGEELQGELRACLASLEPQPYGPPQVREEVEQARAQAQAVAVSKGVDLLEPGIFTPGLVV